MLVLKDDVGHCKPIYDIFHNLNSMFCTDVVLPMEEVWINLAGLAFMFAGAMIVITSFGHACVAYGQQPISYGAWTYKEYLLTDPYNVYFKEPARAALYWYTWIFRSRK